MDIALARTFLEVAATGSFVAASERLFVTQSAVSLRIHRLEADLGQQLFTRAKTGAVLTPAGHAFERYAISLVGIWEEARQQVGIPQGYSRTFSIGAEHSLWPRLGYRWIDGLRRTLPDLNIRAEVAGPDRLTQMLGEGRVHAALLHAPQLRPGLTASHLIDEDLVMVAAWPQPDLAGIADRYALIDWGPEFVQAHALALPELTNPGLTLGLGTLAAEFVASRTLAAYLPARHVRRDLESGALHLVPDAPRFPYPAWSVWQAGLDRALADVAKRTLAEAVEAAERDSEAVVEKLRDISDQDEVPYLFRRASGRP